MGDRRDRILFVDDEPHVLKGLRRSLLEREDQYDIVFCDSAAAALDELARQPVDVVVSDMRMPCMDGAQLLDEVRRLHPGAIRVILSGYAETESILKTVTVAHVYLAKPCDSETLAAAIARPLALRRRLADPGLLAVIGAVSSLPSLPDLVVRIGDEVRSPHASAASITKLLCQDVAMTAEILRITNSAFFGLGTRVTTALQAVRTLGMETLHALVVELGLFQQFRGHPTMAPLLTTLNHYSLRIGRLAEGIARAAECNETTVKAAQCAGMLSSIGCLIFLDRHPEQCRHALSGAGTDTPLVAAERAAFGATHNLVGAYLLGLWGFSDEMIEAVAFAPEPGAAPGRDNPVLTALHVAMALGPRFPLLADGAAPSPKLDMAYLIEARQDKHVRRWEALAAEQSGEE
ncbi:MAG: HDOD domain-containing protein [Magnetospirillum sp.]|nr:HDOD domain-containing protein [Magnetospirillum sp.]